MSTGLLHKPLFFPVSLLLLLLLLLLPSLDAAAETRQIHPLRPQLGTVRTQVPGLSCLSWRLAVETDNIINWDLVPQACEGYVGNYMLGGQYRLDSAVVANEAYLYAKNLTLPKDGKNIWVFDIDETSLSNLPYYALPANGFGAQPFNLTSFNEWCYEAKAPALPETLKLYKQLIGMGIKPVFITGRGVEQTEITTKNLKRSGFFYWRKLILKDKAYSGETALVYKSAARKRLVKAGFRIVGNMGDQWSDVLGNNPGDRTFKLPDPMYYIS